MARENCVAIALLCAAVLLLFGQLVALGVISARIATPRPLAPLVNASAPLVNASAPLPCPDSTALMRAYCGQAPFVRRCFDLVAEVETLLLAGTKSAIFDALEALEPQPGPIFYWAVDEASENEDSHLDLRTEGIAEYFDNNAYFYAQERHRESARCGGWSLTFWRRSAEDNGTRSLQLAYCEDNAARVRACGAFDVLVDSE